MRSVTHNGGMTKHELMTPMSCERGCELGLTRLRLLNTHISKQESTTTGKDEEQDNPEVGLDHCCEPTLDVVFVGALLCDLRELEERWTGRVRRNIDWSPHGRLGLVLIYTIWCQWVQSLSS